MPNSEGATAETGACGIDRCCEAAGQEPTTRPASAERDGGAASEGVGNFRVALVTMPFATYNSPSIQLGLLKAITRRAGFPVDDYYLNVDFAAQLGELFYVEVQGGESATLLGEWMFSVAAFGEESSSAKLIEAFPTAINRLSRVVGVDVANLNELREHALPEFIDGCLSRVDWGSYGAVGFTSTFEQNVASLALARRIKQKYPHVAIVFGGANMDGCMGIEFVRAFPFIDFAVSGEGDEVLPELLRRLAEGKSAEDMLGISMRRGDVVSLLGPSPPIRDLDNLPTPDYDSYYESLRRHGLLRGPASILTKYGNGVTVARGMVIQSSRGCWWGQKSHCTFCGFNGSDITFRSKSPARVLAEIDELSDRYGARAFVATDSIMDVKHIEGVLEPLARRHDGPAFVLYTKSNLSREQVHILARGGAQLIIPGIESLSTEVLRLMRKGVSMLQNVNTLRWATHYGILVGYNLLRGFPGEKVEYYADELRVVRLINHLLPPSGVNRISLHRFSPNFDDYERFPKESRWPKSAYHYIYPPYVNLDEAAYYFDHDLPRDVVPEEEFRETIDAVDRWKTGFFSGCRPWLNYRWTEGKLRILDTRKEGTEIRTHTFARPDADVYEAFSAAPYSPAQVSARLAASASEFGLDEESIASTCDTFCDMGLMLGENGKYLSLAIPDAIELNRGS